MNPLFLKVVVDYLSKKYEAKTAAEIPDEERTRNRLTFEEQLVHGGCLVRLSECTAFFEIRKPNFMSKTSSVKILYKRMICS